MAYDTGLAAIATAEEVKRQMVARASVVWEVQAGDVEFRDGVFICTKTEDRLTFKELAAQLNRTGGPVTCSASVNSGGSGSTFAGNIVDVEVDPETGKVDILRYTAFMDAGTSVHPSYVEGQVQGATVQGIGWALNEEYFYTEDGAMANSSFLDYRMPTSLDVPMIDTVLIEVPNPRHPFGLRGVGEVPIIPPAGRPRQRHLRCGRHPHVHAAHVARRNIGGPRGEKGKGLSSSYCGIICKNGPGAVAPDPSFAGRTQRDIISEIFEQEGKCDSFHHPSGDHGYSWGSHLGALPRHRRRFSHHGAGRECH